MFATEPAAGPAAPEHGDGGFLRVRLDLAYDGTGFAGWAVQPGQRTVQGVVEDALRMVLRLAEPVATTVAGRTDTGVHARGQVAHVDVPVAAWQGVPGRSSRTPSEALRHRLRGVLPPDVRVVSAAPAPTGFDARFSALSRHYTYQVSDAAWGVDPLRRHEVVHHDRALDVDVMTQAAAGLLGEHDFAAYCRPRPGASTTRRLDRFTWRRDGYVLTAHIVADAFCHHQVRAMVGACLAVGEGRRPVAWPATVLAAGERTGAVTVAPAHGLTLTGVDYPPDEELAARAAQTRRVRSPAAP